MTAYFIVQVSITEEAQYQKYREAVVPFIAKFGGKLAARGAKVHVFEGEHDTRPVVMFEFPSWTLSMPSGIRRTTRRSGKFARASRP